ncbi:hypothetical protein NDU88_004088 [Pleurodeles waltl]|uniref:Uncharacterized protein n=1 Tax=Pleurodeles waltl TaxID=8319 RepID=A0AAV7UFJ0_PLEWA|nr:hypothetical protein NDU88_004088 [Pleurodeles waltl]
MRELSEEAHTPGETEEEKPCTSLGKEDAGPDLQTATTSPDDKERYPGSALQSADVTSADMIPEVKETTESTKSSALYEEREEAVAKSREQERNRSATLTEQRTTETPSRAS